MKRIGIIGAGAAGIFAALSADPKNNQIALLEQNEKIGKRILVTGAGRCNLGNRNTAFHSYNTSSAKLNQNIKLLSDKDLEKLVTSFGIPVYSTDDGWMYPVSNSAASVVKILGAQLERNRIRCEFNTTISSIFRSGEIYKLTSVNGIQYEFDRLILCSGGLAHPELGTGETMLKALQKMGYQLIPVRPALSPITTDKSLIKYFDGLRIDCGVRLYNGNHLAAESYGNIIFTNWGLNGPGVMNVSHTLSPSTGKYRLELDFLKGKRGLIEELVAQQETSGLSLESLLLSVFAPKFVDGLKKVMDLPFSSQIDSQHTLEDVFQKLSSFSIKVNDSRGYEYSQASIGGINIEDIDCQTYESKKHPGLYFAGEILDIVGPCGGYNLHFAFSSGHFAGAAASKS